MDKHYFIKQLADQLRASAEIAFQAGKGAAEAANAAASKEERGETMRTYMEQASLARGQSRRSAEAMRDLNRLHSLRPEKSPNGTVVLGSVVEIEDDESGEGKTLFLAPVGAGATLTMPGGDGHLSVVTPVSPIGKAIMGKRVDDVVDVTTADDVREWIIRFVD